MNPMKTLMGALPIVAAAFGRKFSVQVKVGGDQACTDGKVIQIPAIGEDPDAAILAWGYLTHEAAHCPLHRLRGQREPRQRADYWPPSTRSWRTCAARTPSSARTRAHRETWMARSSGW